MYSLLQCLICLQSLQPVTQSGGNIYVIYVRAPVPLQQLTIFFCYRKKKSKRQNCIAVTLVQVSQFSKFIKKFRLLCLEEIIISGNQSRTKILQVQKQKIPLAVLIDTHCLQSLENSLPSQIILTQSFIVFILWVQSLFAFTVL